MKIGRFVISRIRKTPAGLDIYPWQALTEDRVSPELRKVVAKVARSEVKSFLQEMREQTPADRTGVACAVLHTDNEGNPVPCPGYPHEERA